MARRSKKKSSGTSQKKSHKKRKNQRKNLFLWLGGVISVAIIVFVFFGHIPFVSRGSEKGKSFSVQGGKTIEEIKRTIDKEFGGRPTTGKATFNLRGLYEKLNCVCGRCNDTLAVCKCKTATMMRDQVALAEREHKTEKEILDQMVVRHGLKVLARTKNK